MTDVVDVYGAVPSFLAGIIQRMEVAMKRTLHLSLVASLVINITPSWGQPVCVAPGCNPTASDVNQNTAGGTGALGSLSTGTDNTAFGTNALKSNTTGILNTAVGVEALQHNTIGIV